jgi:hypothetical protein
MVGVGLLAAFIGKGDNRGKVLEALKHPIISSTTETFKYGRKNSAFEGLVIEHKTKIKEFTVGDLIALIITGGIVYIASEGVVRDLLDDIFDFLTPEIPGLPDAIRDPGVMAALADAFENALDPLGLFD